MAIVLPRFAAWWLDIVAFSGDEGTVRTPQTVVRARWFLLALVPLAIGAAAVAVGLHILSAAIERMPRVVVPGSGTVALDAGDYTAYGELRSVYGDAVYITGSLHLRCGLTTVDDGSAVALSSPTASVSYTLGGFQGESMFALTIPRAGRYQLMCEGEGGPATVAFGNGIGGRLLTLLLGGPLGFIGGIVVAIVVWRRRRRARSATPPAEPAAPPPVPAPNVSPTTSPEDDRSDGFRP